METQSDAIPRHADTGGGGELDGGFPGFDPSVITELLAGLDPSGVDADRLLTGITGMERVVAAAHAAQVKMLAAFSRLRPATSEEPFGEFVADEIAAELCMTHNAAANRVAQAVVMTTRTPAVLRALESGVLDLYRARIITEAVYGMDEATATQIADHVVDQAEGRNAPQIRALVRQTILRVDPNGAQRRHEQARTGRKVVLDPREEGMAELIAFLPADQATAVYRRVDALARGSRAPGDQRGADARRADVFVNLLLGRRDPGVVGEPTVGCGRWSMSPWPPPPWPEPTTSPRRWTGTGRSARRRPEDRHRPHRGVEKAGHRPGRRDPDRTLPEDVPATGRTR